MIEVIHANILHMPVRGAYETYAAGWLVLKDGVIEGVYERLPEKFAPLPVTDYGDAILTQSFCDMHLHAPQYPMLGMGMDLPLLEWLDRYTYDAEAHFADLAFARDTYRELARRLIRLGTTRVCAFGSLHTDATLILMEELERAGVTGYAGKVNMDRNGGRNLSETTGASMAGTLRFLDESERFVQMRPILTPRFTPSCTDGLMRWLGDLANERGLYVQSHLSENRDEMEWVRRLRPDCASYWETYASCGLLNEKTIMAHCVHSDAAEREALRARGALVAHCPDSNVNLCSGTAPVREMLDSGVWVVLGSDIAGGARLSMRQVACACVRASNVKRVESGWTLAPVPTAEAAYLATSSGAQYFGAGPGFMKGDALHAVVLDESGLPAPARPLTLAERYERWLYLSGEDGVRAVYSQGRRVV